MRSPWPSFGNYSNARDGAVRHRRRFCDMTKTLETASVVIATLNRPDEIQRCVKSVVNQSIRPRQLIVIDAGDLQHVRGPIEDTCQESEIEFIYQQGAPSTTMQRNLGATHVDSSVVYFLDDDVELESDYIQKTLELYERDSERRIAGVSGVIDPCYVSSTGFWRWYKKFFLLAETRKDAHSRLKSSNFPIHLTELSCVRECEIMPSTAVSYRIEVFRQYEFDRDLTGYVMAEDLDLSYRISRSFSLLTTPEAVYRHSKSKVSRNSPREMEKRRLLFTQYFFRKNQGASLWRHVARYWSIIGLLLRTLYIGVSSGNLQRFLGVCDGIRAAAKNKLLGPRRFRPGPLVH